MKLRLLPIALSIGALGLVLSLGQCKKAEATAPQRVPYLPISAEHADSFSGANAHDHVAKIVAFGPRPPQSEGYEKTLKYLESTLDSFGWKTTRQTFRAATPDGPVDFTNLLARHPSAPDRPNSTPVIIGGHIDSKKLSFPFVGANDGGSSTGVMLEIARILSSDHPAAAQVELAFFDGEEAFRPGITPSDGLYGSKFFAHELGTRPNWPAIGIVLDIVGDPDFRTFHNPEAPTSFGNLVDEIAGKLEFAKPVVKAPGPIIDDHVPLQNTGLPCLHLIGDFTTMDYWHQPGDTLDKIDPGMLEKVGKLTLRFLSEVQPPSEN
ncbi:M28 family metallopeptidase [Haloferula sp.]|uniref:M28 family metallopeptidase n=1 Tax=Haloferula sp. TaxID=2497595 RepID=UPI00329BB3C4